MDLIKSAVEVIFIIFIYLIVSYKIKKCIKHFTFLLGEQQNQLQEIIRIRKLFERQEFRIQYLENYIYSIYNLFIPKEEKTNSRELFPKIYNDIEKRQEYDAYLSEKNLEFFEWKLSGSNEKERPERKLNRSEYFKTD